MIITDILNILSSQAFGTVIPEQVVNASKDDGWSRAAVTNFTADVTILNHNTATTNWAFLRFPGIEIPQGSEITSAVLSVNVESTARDDVDTTLYCEDIDDSTDLDAGNTQLESRDLTTASIAWAQDSLGAGFRDAPAITDAVQEVINRGGWVSGNAIGVIAVDTQSAKRCDIRTYDFAKGQTARLNIDYNDGSTDISIAVSASLDDATREFNTPSFSVTSLFLIVGVGNPTTIRDYSNGMIFRGLGIPKSATITSAWIKFQGFSAFTKEVNSKIRAYDADDYSDDLSTVAKFEAIFPGSLTTAEVLWDDMPPVGSDRFPSPEIKTVIQEVVNRPGWSGNDMVIFWDDFDGRTPISTNATQTFSSWDHPTGLIPTLLVSYIGVAGGRIFGPVII